jgi:hypothetical protein
MLWTDPIEYILYDLTRLRSVHGVHAALGHMFSSNAS